jgi:hypothetical protein
MPIHDWTRVYAGLFHDFHQSWSIRIKDALNTGLLPKGLTALVEQKTPRKEPDVVTVDFRESDKTRSGAVARTLTLNPPTTRIVRKSTKESYADKANRIVVKHKLGRTVAVIEIVSPGNKDGKQAFQEFLDKSLEFIGKGIHLLIVDLLPPSKRDPNGVHRALWEEYEEEDDEFTFPAGKNLTLASYNEGREKAAYVEPLAVGDVMPDMPLFLIDDYHVMVPLEATYQATWSFLPKEMQEYVLTGVLPGEASE